MSNFLSFIVKDTTMCSDNLLNIVYDENDIVFICTCGVELCCHCDYMVTCLSKIINNTDTINENKYTLIGFQGSDYLELEIKDFISNYIHYIRIVYHNNKFSAYCSCKNKKCKTMEYAILRILLMYNEKKEKQAINTTEKIFNDLTL